MEKRVKRVFGESLKREIVSRLEVGEVRVSDIMNTYKVSSTSVYKWRDKYGNPDLKGVRVVVEKESAELRVRDLEKLVKERDSALGEIMMKLRYLEKENVELKKVVKAEQKKN
jgi:transposase-like protein